ncbi:uncharacterized protein LOC135163679 [Diachasmimorpha longicaudata]|uniref:uncharacterized protein LOC135163679 n=1 Tax=Diachasmimorpha longicaudata TaxID=58733 RepID=UPI0030B912C7
MSCCVCGIERSPLTRDVCFHSLPKNPETRRKWLDLLQKGDAKRLVVCGNHFTPEDYRESSMKPLLKPDAVPRRELVEIFRNTKPQNKSQSELQQSETVTDDHTYYCMKLRCADALIAKESPHEEGDRVIPQDPEGLVNDLDTSERTSSEQPENSDVNEKINSSSSQVLRDASNVKSPKIEPTGHLKRKLKPGYVCQPPARKRLYVGEFGVFRPEDFKKEATWHRFVNLYLDLKRETILLKRKNERLNDRMTMYKKMVAHLQKTQREGQ